MTATACIGEPVSWLALERLALAELDATATAAVRAHLDGCVACAGAFARITDDTRPLPPLPARAVRAVRAVATPWWRSWAWLGGGAGALVATAAVVLLAVRPGSRAATPANSVRVKGAGVVAVTLVRDRGGVIAFDPADVVDDDRWKIELSCAPGGAAWVDVAVIQGRAVGFPLAAQTIACGNSVAVPGAFRITDGGAELCVALAAAAPDRARMTAGERAGTVCRTLRAATR